MANVIFENWSDVKWTADYDSFMIQSVVDGGTGSNASLTLGTSESLSGTAILASTAGPLLALGVVEVLASSDIATSSTPAAPLTIGIDEELSATNSVSASVSSFITMGENEGLSNTTLINSNAIADLSLGVVEVVSSTILNTSVAATSLLDLGGSELMTSPASVQSSVDGLLDLGTFEILGSTNVNASTTDAYLEFGVLEPLAGSAHANIDEVVEGDLSLGAPAPCSTGVVIQSTAVSLLDLGVTEVLGSTDPIVTLTGDAELTLGIVEDLSRIIDEDSGDPLTFGLDVTGSGTATASSSDPSGLPAKAFDDTTGGMANGWYCDQSNGWITYDFGLGNEKQIEQYTIQVPDDSLIANYPSSWGLYGSNNNSDWDLLHIQGSPSAFTQGEKRTFSFKNTTDYRYIRLTSSSSGSILLIAELEYMEALTREEIGSGSLTTSDLTLGITEVLTATAPLVAPVTSSITLGIIETTASTGSIVSTVIDSVLTLGAEAPLTSTIFLETAGSGDLILGITEVLEASTNYSSAADGVAILGEQELLASSRVVVSYAVAELSLGAPTSLSHTINNPEFVNDDYTSLLLNLNNSNQDESDYNHDITLYAGAAFDATDKLFGSHALDMNGGYTIVDNTDNASDLDFDTGDYAIELGFKDPGVRTVGQGNYLIKEISGSDSHTFKYTQYNATTLTFEYKIIDSGVTEAEITFNINQDEIDDWTYVTIFRISGTIYIRFDGSDSAFTYSVNDNSYANWPDLETAPYIIGEDIGTIASPDLHIDAIRISKGTGRYDSGTFDPFEYVAKDISGSATGLLYIGLGEILTSTQNVISNTVDAELSFGAIEDLSHTPPVGEITYTTDLCNGGTPSASSEINASYSAAEAFDNVDNYSWCSLIEPAPYWLKYEFTSAQTINKITMKDWNTSSSPNTFEVQGSNNDSDWNTVASFSGQTWTSSEIKEFTFENNSSYLYYRIYITAINGGITCQIAELEMMGIESTTSGFDINSDASAVTINLGITEGLSSSILATTDGGTITGTLTLGIQELLASTIANTSASFAGEVQVGNAEILSVTTGAQVTTNVNAFTLVYGGTEALSHTMTPTGFDGIAWSEIFTDPTDPWIWTTSSGLLLIGTEEILSATADITIEADAVSPILGQPEPMTSTGAVVESVTASELILGKAEDLSASIGPISTTSESLLDLGVTEILADVDNALTLEVTGELTLGAAEELSFTLYEFTSDPDKDIMVATLATSNIVTGVDEILAAARVGQSVVEDAVLTLGGPVLLEATTNITTTENGDLLIGHDEEMTDECVSWTSVDGQLTTGIVEVVTATIISNSVADAELTLGITEPLSASIDAIDTIDSDITMGIVEEVTSTRGIISTVSQSLLSTGILEVVSATSVSNSVTDADLILGITEDLSSSIIAQSSISAFISFGVTEFLSHTPPEGEPAGYYNRCVGGTATAIGSDYGTSPDRAFDNSWDDPVTDGWIYQVANNNASSWIQYQFTSAITITRLRLLSYYNGTYEGIASYTLKASNTGSFSGEEVTIYNGYNSNSEYVALWEDETFTNENSYLYYRIVINSNFNGNGQSQRSIREIELMEYAEATSGYDAASNVVAAIDLGDTEYIAASRTTQTTTLADLTLGATEELAHTLEAIPGSYTEDLCEDGTATANDFWTVSENYAHPDHAFDNELGDSIDYGWVVEGTSGWLQYQFTSAKQIEKLRLYSYYDRGIESVDSFSFKASTTGAFSGEEVTLYTGNNPANTASFVEYTFSNSTPYSYYRIVVHSVHTEPGNTASHLGITEVEMMEQILVEPFAVISADANLGFGIIETASVSTTFTSNIVSELILGITEPLSATSNPETNLTDSTIELGGDEPLSSSYLVESNASATTIIFGVSELLASSSINASTTDADLTLGITEDLSSTVNAQSNVALFITMGVVEDLSHTPAPIDLGEIANADVEDNVQLGATSSIVNINNLAFRTYQDQSSALIDIPIKTNTGKYYFEWRLTAAGTANNYATWTAMSFVDDTDVTNPYSRNEYHSRPSALNERGSLLLDTSNRTITTYRNGVLHNSYTDITTNDLYISMRTLAGLGYFDFQLYFREDDFLYYDTIDPTNSAQTIAHHYANYDNVDVGFAVSDTTAIATLGVDVPLTGTHIIQSNIASELTIGVMEMLTSTVNTTTTDSALIDLGVSEVLGSAQVGQSNAAANLTLGIVEDLSYTLTTLHVGDTGDLFIDGEDNVIEDENGTWTINTVGSPTTVNGTVRFNGSSGLYISDPSGDIDLSGDFTIDTKVTFDSLPSSVRSGLIFTSLDSVSSGWNLMYDKSNEAWFIKANSINKRVYDSDVEVDTEYHIALTHSGSNYYMFKNGELLETFTLASTMSSGSNVQIGYYDLGATTSYTTGNFDNTRIVIGEALWTEEFDSDSDLELFYDAEEISTVAEQSVVSISPLTLGVPEPLSGTTTLTSVVGDTILNTGIIEVLGTLGFGITTTTSELTLGVDEPLSHSLAALDNPETGVLFIDGESVIEDENGNHTITNLNTTINTNTKKYGSGSLYFNGSAYIDIPSSTDFDIPTNSKYTIDFWLNPTDMYIDETYMFLMIAGRAVPAERWCILRVAGNIGIMLGTTWLMYVSESNFPEDQWSHVAFVRDGNDWTMYINGNSVDTATNTKDVAIEGVAGLTIGNYNNSTTVYEYEGYMDNIRITQDALWTSSFDIDSNEEMFYSTPSFDVSSNVVGLLEIPGADEALSSTITMTTEGDASTLDTGVLETASAFKMIWSQIHTPELILGIWEQVAATDGAVAITVVDGEPLIMGVIEILATTVASHSVADASLTLGIGEYVAHTLEETFEIPATYTDDQCSGGTPSMDSTYLGYTPDQAFDNSLGSLASSNNVIGPHWLRYEFSTSKTIRKYTLGCTNAWGVSEKTMPKDFIFQGSTNGSTWVDLDTQTDQTFSSSEVKEYEISNTNSYKYYRIYMTANDYSSGYMQVGEFEMMEIVTEYVPATTPSFADTSAVGFLSTGEDELLASTIITPSVTAGELIFGLIEVMSATRIVTSMTIGVVYAGIEEILESETENENGAKCEMTMTAILGRTPCSMIHNRERSQRGSLFR